MAEKWEHEDRELAITGISNPWDKYPPGRPRNWLRARSTLVISEDTAEIRWATETAKSVARQNLEKEAELQASGLTLVRERDVLTEVLGQPEQTRCMHVEAIKKERGSIQMWMQKPLKKKL